ncbi:hypothetical protein LX36DRAFT_754592 [Colletotrichum falcatum]|nr:hypothetical protein LX36DRAFT_754592 [Colletotrichum falcatum]
MPPLSTAHHQTPSSPAVTIGGRWVGGQDPSDYAFDVDLTRPAKKPAAPARARKRASVWPLVPMPNPVDDGLSSRFQATHPLPHHAGGHAALRLRRDTGGGNPSRQRKPRTHMSARRDAGRPSPGPRIFGQAKRNLTRGIPVAIVEEYHGHSEPGR